MGRIKFKPYITFILLWGLFVYAPIAHWVSGGGFLTGKTLDFAGGTFVHISYGISSLAILCSCIFISGIFYDFSYDGQSYHQATVLELINGFNPVYDNVGDTPFNITETYHEQLS